MRSLKRLAGIAAMLAALTFAAVPAAEATAIYVATNGNVANCGAATTILCGP